MKQIGEILEPYARTIATDLAKQYVEFKKKFIETFIKSEPFRYCCVIAVKDFETNISEYQEDEKISLYVEKLIGLKATEKEVLKRTLVMIKKII